MKLPYRARGMLIHLRLPEGKRQSNHMKKKHLLWPKEGRSRCFYMVWEKRMSDGLQSVDQSPYDAVRTDETQFKKSRSFLLRLG